MKTTIELPDDLFVAAKERAAESRTTLRALVERGLRRELRDDSAQRSGGAVEHSVGDGRWRSAAGSRAR